MPYLQVNGASMRYEDYAGTGDTVVFIHGLMLPSESFEAQVAALRGRYRVLTYDLRGQGKSEKTAEGLTIDGLTSDAIVLIESLAQGPVHLVAFSMGTFIALRVAARRPELVRTLCLIGPSAEAEDPSNMPKYKRLIQFVRLFGPRPVAAQLMKILFGDTYLSAPDVAVARRRWLKVVQTLPRALHRAAAASAHRPAITDELKRIRAPTLVVSGEEDRPISPLKALAVQAGISGAAFVSFPATGHAVMIERPDAFNAALSSFLAGASGAADRQP